MTVKAQKPIVIFRGDNTAAFDLRTITILLTGDLDLSHATARFTLLDFSKTWTEQEVATGELSIVFTAEQTKAFALGPQTGTLRLYDMSTGTPRQLTIVNKIPFFVTNRVCEIDSQSYEADVCVSGGDVIHIEFKVGSGAVEGKADKVKNATTGDLASLTPDGNLEDSGIPKTDVLRKSQMDSAPTEGSSNPVTSDGIKQAIDAATPSDYEQVKAQVGQNTTDIAAIEGKIPAQATAQNQLADKAFVNSSIATNTATFRGSYNLVSDLGLTVSATEQQVAAAIAAKLASLVPPVVPENNDYVFVQVPRTDADPTVIERVDRYKCTVTESGGVTTRVWEYEWSLNNSSFTADQWAAINSGMTAADVTKLAGIEAGAQVNTVTSVNSKTGAVTLTASDVGAVKTNYGSASNLTVSFLSMAGSANASCDLLILSAQTFQPSQEKRLILRNELNQSAITETSYYDGRIVRDGKTISLPSVAGTLALLSDIAVKSIKLNGTDLTPDANGAVNVQALGSSGNQTLDGALHSLGLSVSNAADSNREAYLARIGIVPPGALRKGQGKLGFVLGLTDDTARECSLYIDDDGKVYINTPSGYVEVPNATNGGTLSLLENLASEFDSTATYKLNQLCIHNGKLFSCDDPISQAGSPWNPSCWHVATVDEVLSALRTTINGKAPLASPAFTGTPTAPTPTAGDNSTKVATTAFVKTAVAGVPLRYDMPTSVALVAENDEATLVCADRAVTNATIATGFSTLNLTFPEAISGKVRDFYLRITVAAGESAPALSIPQGITIENPDGAVPEIADGETSAAATTLVWLSETAPNVFTAKSETVKAVA